MRMGWWQKDHNVTPMGALAWCTPNPCLRYPSCSPPHKPTGSYHQPRPLYPLPLPLTLIPLKGRGRGRGKNKG